MHYDNDHDHNKKVLENIYERRIVGSERTNMSRETQADAVMNRFLNTLQEISTAIQRQSQENAATQERSNKVLQCVGKALEDLVGNSNQTNEAGAPLTINKNIDLVEFNGEDRSLWPSWHIQAQGKAGSSGPDPSVQFFTIFNKLKGNAVKNVTPWVKQNLASNTATSEGLLKELARLYDDPAQEAKALNNLKTMKQQERESFGNFFTKFEKDLANAGGASLSSQVKIMFLRLALNSRFKNCLPKTKHYGTYEELVIDLQNAAATMANEDVLFARRDWGQVQSRPQNFSPMNEPTPMDWAPTSANYLGRTTNEPSKRPRARWVTKETLKARRDANCCLRCGNSNHYQPRCPYRPPINPNQPMRNQQGNIVNPDPSILLTEPMLPLLEESDGDRDLNGMYGSSGKE